MSFVLQIGGFIEFCSLSLTLGSVSLSLSFFSDPAGVKRINKELAQITLPPAAFSASSVYNNQPEFFAHKANLVVFASQEESSGAWCPAVPVQNRLTEWLQVDFDTAKLMAIIFTEGSTTNSVSSLYRKL
ncbi:Discoidin domain-containing receptor 2 [Fasciolopsis buskii]|uniref:Discoidin domain-containing receptor 2 n=1 Tax=Fasciolopsis buskii TaxID=27845 RepID=A0A8E0S6Q6_9TREM|nr:Discoidin domain-containing receptor 2 [Fasciolopsis buski]